MLADERIDDHSFIRHEPLGPVLALMPWNYPFWQVVRFAAPALMAGNVGLLKHADNVPQCGEALEDLFRRAGFAPGCFQYLAVPVAGVTGLIDDPRIVAVTLTGSVGAGRAVAAAAGAQIKRTVLELGGSDPFIVMPSADFDRTVAQAVEGAHAKQRPVLHRGQALHRPRLDPRPLCRRAGGKAFRRLRVGDPLAPATQLGPLAHARGLETLERQVRDAVQAGAKILTGGRRIGQRGFFYEPTVLAGLPREAPDRARGILRPGRPPLPRPRSRRGARPGQRHALRPRRQHLDPRRRRTAARHRRTRKRPGLRQRHRRLRPRVALRRHQALRLRPRARRRGDPRIRQRQERAI